MFTGETSLVSHKDLKYLREKCVPTSDVLRSECVHIDVTSLLLIFDVISLLYGRNLPESHLYSLPFFSVDFAHPPIEKNFTL